MVNKQIKHTHLPNFVFVLPKEVKTLILLLPDEGLANERFILRRGNVANSGSVEALTTTMEEE